ncbi:MAG: cellulase family glycosylhydrolase, partial [Muribaculaceae bacterium]|nr:cellulase family glycosylhydrolase [Muribaculaceae bacterium]
MESTFSSCSDDKHSKLENPYAMFCEVNSEENTLSELTFGGYQTYQMIDIRTNVNWKLSQTPEWLTISNHSGKPTTHEPLHLKVAVEENATGSARTPDLLLTGDQAQKSTLRISQEALVLDDWQTALEVCDAMKVGLNLYNTLDAVGTWFDQDDVHAFETCWGQPVADQEWFTAVKAAGFNAVRIPVTWYPHMTEDWVVKEPWMNRVEEVVNYALNAGLYAIINVHHDGEWLAADYPDLGNMLPKYTSLWRQIAERFNKYGDHLLFAAYNEIADRSGKWDTPASYDGYLALNIIAQEFVNTVRSTGGNNEHRNLVIPTYCANGAQERLDNLKLPDDKYAKHLLVEVHNYSPVSFTHLLDSGDDAQPAVWTSAGEAQLKKELDVLANYTKETNVPILIGECGVLGDVNEDVENGKFAEVLS